MEIYGIVLPCSSYISYFHSDLHETNLSERKPPGLIQQIFNVGRPLHFKWLLPSLQYAAMINKFHFISLPWDARVSTQEIWNAARSAVPGCPKVRSYSNGSNTNEIKKCTLLINKVHPLFLRQRTHVQYSKYKQKDERMYYVYSILLLY
jgi:hypothetical protein